MPIEGSLTPDEQTVLQSLRDADRCELKARFAALPPPNMADFEGEFDAELLSQGGQLAYRLTAAVFGVYGPWTGKAFRSTGHAEGEGYNCFKDQQPKLFMRTYLGESRISGGNSMFIDYRSHNSGPVRWLVGELRLAGPTVVLGFGAFGPRIGRRDRWRRKIPFVMVGPRRPYQLTAPQPHEKVGLRPLASPMSR